MVDTLHLDYESKSDVDLTQVGLDVYSAHPSTRIVMASYRINKNPLQHWEAHKSRPPAELLEALEDPEVEKWGFNAQFERVMTRRVLKVKTPRRRWRCSMVLAYMMSFTGGLKEVGEQIGLPIDKQKLSDGKRLIRKFCMPQRITKNQPFEWRNWITDPEDWELFGVYNNQDVITEEAIKDRLIRYPVLPEQWLHYELDQLINDRGIPVDPDFVQNVIWMSEKRKAELTARMKRITGVDNPGSVAQLLPWLIEERYPYADLRKESVTKALKRHKNEEIELTKPCKTVLELRQWAARTSVKKANKAKLVVGSDGRARFLFQFAGASRTNRFSGREIQSQNLMRTPKELDFEDDDGERLICATNMIRRGEYEAFKLFVDEPMLCFTGAMRGMFRAPDGRQFRVCDFSSIETAGLAWVARCPKLTDVFLTGKDPYLFFGTLMYRLRYEEITRAMRQICTPPMLGCGYRLSAGEDKDGVKTGLLAYAENMGIDMTVEEATRAVTVYRDEFPEVKQFWYDCEKCIRHVLTTHKSIKLGFVQFEWNKPFLLIRLPSGRCIYYYQPKLEQRIYYTGKKIRRRIRSEGYFEHGVPEGQWVTIEEDETRTRTIFTYMGRSQKTGKWTRLEGHGGVVTENIVQALTYDLLMVKAMRADEEGFNLIGHAHDELMTEQDDGENYHTLEYLRELFVEPVDWAPGFPLGAAGWTGQFYRK